MELEKLFSTFHDFDIVALDNRDDSLIMTFRVPWGDMWEDSDFKIKVVLKSGKIIGCTYFEWTDGINTSGGPNSVNKETTDIDTISQLGIDIQRFMSLGDGKYVFFCNGYDKVGGAEIIIKANCFELLDSKDKPLATNKYESWFNEWWTSIRRA